MIAARRPYGVVFPLILVIAGALILLANLGTLPDGTGWRLLQLWPLILVMVGVQLIVPRFFHGTAVPVVTLLLVGAIAVGGLAYAVAGSSPSSASYTRFESSAPAADLTAGSITVDTAGAQVKIRAADVGDNLYQAKIDYAGSTPRVTQAGGDIQISIDQKNVTQWGRRADVIDIALNPGTVWAININGAGTTTTIDFTNGKLSSFSLNGVGGTTNLRGGQPSGLVPVSLSGVGTGMTFTVPAGADYRVIAGGCGTSIDGSQQSDGWVNAADRYDVSVDGLGAHVTVRTQS